MRFALRATGKLQLTLLPKNLSLLGFVRSVWGTYPLALLDPLAGDD